MKALLFRNQSLYLIKHYYSIIFPNFDIQTKPIKHFSAWFL